MIFVVVVYGRYHDKPIYWQFQWGGERVVRTGMLSSVSPEQPGGVDLRLKGPVRFTGPALLGPLGGAYPPRIHSWQLCAVRGLYCCQKGLLGSFYCTVKTC